MVPDYFIFIYKSFPGEFANALRQAFKGRLKKLVQNKLEDTVGEGAMFLTTPQCYHRVVKALKP